MRRSARYSADKLVFDYLGRVAEAARRALATGDRHKFVRRVQASIQEQIGPVANADPDQVVRVLTELGDPAALAKQERQRLEGERRGEQPHVVLWRPAGTTRPWRSQRGAAPPRIRTGRKAARSPGQPPSGPGSARPDPARPVRADPVRADPVRADPVRADPVRADPVRADPVRADPVRADPVRADPRERAEPELAGPEVTEPELARAELAEPELAGPELTEPELAEPELAEPELAGPELAGPDPAGREPGQPPIVPGLHPPGAAPASPEPAEPSPAEAVLALAREHPGETVAVLLIGVGGLIYPFPIWVIGGLVALRSRAWDTRDKWIALIGPLVFALVGLAFVAALGTAQRNIFAAYFHAASGGLWNLLRVGSLVCAGYLAWRVRRGPRAKSLPPWMRSR